MAERRNDEPAAIDLLSGARKALLDALKRSGWVTIPQLAAKLSVSTEAVRQQLITLQREGWVTSDCGPDEEAAPAVGRPPATYCLSARGDDLFPKRYPELAFTLFDELPDPERTLTELTDRRVAAMREALPEQQDGVDAEALRALYRPNDSYLEIGASDRGDLLIEWNCPYLQFASERPLFCSTTVSTLRRLTGCEVVRERRFQDGDGRCVFHIYRDVPLSDARKKRRFEVEPPRDARPAPASGSRR